jgi:hypothetical protein
MLFAFVPAFQGLKRCFVVEKCLHAVASLAFFFLGSSLPFSTCFMNQAPPQTLLPRQTITPEQGRIEQQAPSRLSGNNQRPSPNGESHERGVFG